MRSGAAASVGRLGADGGGGASRCSQNEIEREREREKRNERTEIPSKLAAAG